MVWPPQAVAVAADAKPRPATVAQACIIVAYLLPGASPATATKKPAGLAGRLDAYNVAWNQPGGSSPNSMPLGNGDVGVNAWVEKTGDLVFYISKTNAWDENARLCKIGRVRVKFDPPLSAATDSGRN